MIHHNFVFRNHSEKSSVIFLTTKIKEKLCFYNCCKSAHLWWYKKVNIACIECGRVYYINKRKNAIRISLVFCLWSSSRQLFLLWILAISILSDTFRHTSCLLPCYQLMGCLWQIFHSINTSNSSIKFTTCMLRKFYHILWIQIWISLNNLDISKFFILYIFYIYIQKMLNYK